MPNLGGQKPSSGPEAPLRERTGETKEQHMKNKDVLVMDSVGLIPDYLKLNWKTKMGHDPIEFIRQRKVGSFVLLAIGLLILGVGVTGLLNGNLSMQDGFVAMIIFALFTLGTVRLGKTDPFTTCIEDHLNIFKEEHGHEHYMTLAESATVARSMNAKALTYRAAVVKFAERKYDRDSRQAKWARGKFDRIYLTETLLMLASEKKNDYYDADMRHIVIFPSDLETMAWMSDPDKTPITNGVPFEPTPVATGVTGML